MRKKVTYTRPILRIYKPEIVTPIFCPQYGCRKTIGPGDQVEGSLCPCKRREILIDQKEEEKPPQ